MTQGAEKRDEMSEPNWLVKWLIPSEVTKYEDWLVENISIKITIAKEKIKSQNSSNEVDKAISDAWKAVAIAETYFKG